jgi:methylenetetrahydrofolate dehydrogenase (NADP+)/methenyltetrahydrofolate cyclohydrolase
MARLLDGKALAKRLNAELATRVPAVPRPPGLAVVLVGADPASQVYVRNKGLAAEAIGFRHRQIDLPADVAESEILDCIDGLNADSEVDGILVQLPLPKHVDATRVVDRIDPSKDVDGLTTLSAGLLSQGRPRFVPCTPRGVMELLREAGVDPRGREAIVIGRSNIVGRPMAQLLEQANATVTLAHSRTTDLPDVVRRAEIVVAAVGRAQIVRADWIRDGAIVIDVGMNRDAAGKLCGDVATAEVAERASAITPVPGGVGPMTIAMLMANTFDAALRRTMV